jgi:alpha-1,3-glucan synthase
MEPEMRVENITEVVTVTKASDRVYIRDLETSALDGSAFHYSVYRSMTRFLGMDGIYAAEGDPPVDFVQTWRELMRTNDMANAYTGEFDPRHMFGITNQDVFRWPGIQNGTEKQLLGLFIVTLLFPGIPTLSWGEEQAMYVLENTNDNYVFGSSPV